MEIASKEGNKSVDFPVLHTLRARLLLDCQYKDLYSHDNTVDGPAPRMLFILITADRIPCIAPSASLICCRLCALIALIPEGLAWPLQPTVLIFETPNTRPKEELEATQTAFLQWRDSPNPDSPSAG